MSRVKDIKRSRRGSRVGRLLQMEKAAMLAQHPILRAVRPSKKGRGLTKPLQGPGRTRG